MEEVRAKLAQSFGVTLQGHHLTLRTTLTDGTRVQISLLVNQVELDLPQCDGCGCVLAERDAYRVKETILHDRS